MVRHWHNNKGNSRPTIVNMSFGFFYSIDAAGTQGGDHGQVWDTFTGQMDVWNFGDPGYDDPQEIEDNTDLSGEIACAGGACEIDLSYAQEETEEVSVVHKVNGDEHNTVTRG